MLSAINLPLVQGLIVTAAADSAAKFMIKKYQFEDEKALRGITVTLINAATLFVTLDFWGSFPGFIYGCALLWRASMEYEHQMNRNLKKMYDGLARDDARSTLQGQMRV